LNEIAAIILHHAQNFDKGRGNRYGGGSKFDI